MDRSRKLNSQLENAIQEAMAELDRIPTTTAIKTPTTLTITSDVLRSKSGNVPSSSPLQVKTMRTRVTRASAAAQQRTKLIKIAPAPPNNGQKSFHV